MTAQLIDGNALARQVRTEVAGRVAALKARGVQPQLNVILVGEDPASQVYVRSKGRSTQEVGMVSIEHKLDAATSEAELAAAIAADTDDPANDPDFWQRAELVYPAPKERVTVRLDRDVLTWFRGQGRGYQTRINAVLRSYVESGHR